MNTEIVNAMKASELKSQYDQYAKRLLANKYILAHILVKTVKEFHGMKPADVVCYIEGDPIVGKVSAEPGMTNREEWNHGQRIVGFNSENGEINEGTIYFDIVCYVRLPEGISKIIINIEAQKSEPTNYMIGNRAIFYGCRLISSQKERDFSNSDYDSIKRIFSIWICMNMQECTLNHFQLTDKKILGNYEWRGQWDLMNIIFIGLSDELPEAKEHYELHRLLIALLADHLSLAEKIKIVGEEYHIPIEANLEKEMGDMCNLSEGIWEKAEATGKIRGETLFASLTSCLLEDGRIEDIRKATEDVSYREKLYREYKLVEDGE